VLGGWAMAISEDRGSEACDGHTLLNCPENSAPAAKSAIARLAGSCFHSAHDLEHGRCF
jgi:hypothetical protein